MSENNRPQGWGKDHKLPDNWGKQSSGLESKTLSGGVSMSSSEPDKKSNIKAEDKVSFSDKARSGAGKLARITKKVGGAAKNAAGNAVEYAKSDEAKEKLNAVKSKAKSIADGAGSAFTDLKEKTGDAINERRSSKVESALSDNDISDNAIDDTFAPDTYEETSSDIVQTENSYDDSIDVSDLNPALDSESDESSDTLENAGLSADRQDIPDIAVEDDKYAVTRNRKLNGKWIAIIAIVIISLACDIGGTIFIKKYKEKTGDISSDVENESSEEDTEENESSTSTVADEIITTSIITTETASTTTEQEKTTTSVVADKYQIYKDKILASVNNEEYAGNDSHIENAPADMVFYDIDGTLSQISLSNAVLYAGPGSSYDEVYITRTSETLNIVGENSDWYYLMYYTGTGRFTHSTYGYANKKSSTSNDSKPTETYAFYGIVATDSDSLNLRDKPSTDSNVITQLPKGTKASVYYVEGYSDWYKVYTDNGYEGYVAEQYMKEYNESSNNNEEYKTKNPADDKNMKDFIGKWEVIEVTVGKTTVTAEEMPTIRGLMKIEFFDDGTGIAASSNEDEEDNEYELKWKISGKGKADITDEDGDTITFTLDGNTIKTEYIDDEDGYVVIVLEKVKKFT